MRITKFFHLSLSIVLIFLSTLWSCDNSDISQPPEKKKVSISKNQKETISNLLTQIQSWTDSTNQESILETYKELTNTYAQIENWDSAYYYSYDVYLNSRNLKKFKEGINFLTNLISQATAPPDTIQAKIYELIGYSWFDLGRTEKALESYKNSIDIWQNYPVSTRLIRNYNMLGLLHMNLGEHAIAETIHKNSISQAINFGDTIIWQKHLNNLGEAYLGQDRWEDAIEKFEQAYSLIPEEDGHYQLNISSALLDGGNIYEALSLAELALEKHSNYKGFSTLERTKVLWGIGKIYTKLKKYKEAKDQYITALESALTEYPSGNRQIGKAYLFLGDAYHKLNLPQLALDSYQKAMGIFLPYAKNKPVAFCPPHDSLFSREFFLIDIIQNKGRVFFDLFKSTNQLEYLKYAVDHFLTTMEYVNQTKLQYLEPESKSFFSNYTHPYATEAIRALLLLHQNTNNPVHLEQAYYVARQASAFLLRNQVGEKQALNIAGVPSVTITLWEDINKSIVDVQYEIQDPGTEIAIMDSLEALEWSLKKDRIDLIEQIQNQYPRYYSIRQELNPKPLAELQAQLGTGHLAINYFISDTIEYIFVFTKDQFKVIPLTIDTTLLDDIQSFRQTLSDLDYIRDNPQQAEQTFLETSHTLYETLIDTALHAFDTANITDLLIIPDGLLNYLTFECLLQRPTDSWLDTEAFLIKDYNIRYAYYADLLLEEDIDDERDNRLLGFGTTYNTQTLESLSVPQIDSVQNPALQDALRDKNFSELLYAEEEIRQINELVGGRIFLGEQATKSNFITHSSEYPLIHLAAHSFVDEENDSLAYLAFQQNAEDEDFLLSLADIYGLQMDAELVALSSCQTSLGALKPSEGVMSLARAFHTAGAESLIASQWSISDRSSYQIMTNFYTQLQAGASKSEALRLAKLEYLNDDFQSSPAYRLPAYWAPLVLIGNPEPLELAPANSYNWLLLTLLAVLVVCIFIWNYRSR